MMGPTEPDGNAVQIIRLVPEAATAVAEQS
jgi:hypothetical protein